MLRRLGLNMLWSSYRYKGQKGKNALIEQASNHKDFDQQVFDFQEYIVSMMFSWIIQGKACF